MEIYRVGPPLSLHKPFYTHSSPGKLLLAFLILLLASQKWEQPSYTRNPGVFFESGGGGLKNPKFSKSSYSSLIMTISKLLFSDLKR
jgi:hypothetical protein